MTVTESRAFRILSTVMAFAMVNLAAPQGAVTLLAPAPNAPRPAEAPKKAPKRTRLLSARAMRSAQGRAGENPYLAGQNKWDVLVEGINLMTGNYSLSATDLAHEGGYGIPVNVTRSYSSNSGDEGPLGYGWNLSVDVRSTAGGLLKSSSSPVRSVPTSFKERPTGDNDPHLLDANEPVSAVVATDAGGTEETIQRDVDGVLTTPPWDKNVIDSEYEYVTVGSNTYQVLKKNVVKTLEGTVYEYSKHGSYVNGMVARSGGVTGEPSNVLKIDKVTDRHGNQTLYTYASSSPASFVKSNGTTTEDRLVGIAMPNGHHLGFTWSGNRIVKALDLTHSGTGVLREVAYGYTNGRLTSVTTPAGKVTTYGYGAAAAPAGWGTAVPNGLLTSITDPRGLTTQISYVMANVRVVPNMAIVQGPIVATVRYPNGVLTAVAPTGGGVPGAVVQPGETWGGMTEVSRVVEATGAYISSAGASAIPSDSGEVLTVLIAPSMAGGVNQDPLDTFFVRREYSLASQDLVRETHSIQPDTSVPFIQTALDEARRAIAPSWVRQHVTTETESNFMGNPLRKTVVESTLKNSGRFGLTWFYSPAKVTDYAYWGGDKYYQQKAVKVTTGASAYRYSFTDYYDANAPQGFKGQTKAVYDAKYATYDFSTGTVPANTDAADAWRYKIAVSGIPAVEFPLAAGGNPGAYDAKGRVVRVRKLQKVVSGTPSYVETRTTYGADVAEIWGQATSVTEAYGTPDARTTQTLAFTPDGKAKTVQDANGRVFETAFDADGVVQSVTRTDTNPDQPVATYTYGTSGVTNGQPTQIADGLSGINLSFGYASSGAGIGQVTSVTQSGGTWSWGYGTSYTYNAAGERERATYDTPAGVTTWEYRDYIRVGDPTQGTRAFQTLRKLDGGGNGTSEEMHYVYDSAGRLRNAMFAQRPQTGTGTPTSAPYYTSGYPAASRAISYYDYDPSGRTLELSHGWQTWNGSAYSTPTVIFQNGAAYDPYKGLKTSSTFYAPSAPAGFNRTETYGYEAERDFLTSASYGDGLPNANPTWTYDASQNRSNGGYTYDALNRMTASPDGWSYAHDPVGNRLNRTKPNGDYVVYEWDAANRMTRYFDQPRTTYTNYEYRPDGLRAHKAQDRPGQATLHESSRYDGTMPFEQATYMEGGSATITRSGLGARGIDVEEAKTGTYNSSTGFTLGSWSAPSYPLYDAHGNRVCTLTRSGTNSYATDAPRTYDAWGQVRSGASQNGSPSRYCANLGHVQDDESGLIYMRARFYEPISGRFISEDKTCAGINWYVYADNTPVIFCDPDGNESSIPGVSTGTSLSALMSQLSARVNAMIIQGALRTKELYAGAYLTRWLQGKGEDILNWYYVEQQVIMGNGETGLIKGFVRLYENQMVMRILVEDGADGDCAISHVSPYLDPGVPGRIFIDPRGI